MVLRSRWFGLRPRFLLATALLVVTAVTASLWTLGALSRLSHAVGEALRQNDEATSATARVASAIEREDDALLLVLTGDSTAQAKLGDERRNVDQALDHLDEVLNEPPEQELVDGLRTAMIDYRRAAGVIARSRSLVDYHRDVNPLLRRAVGFTARLRDQHFAASQQVTGTAHDEVVRARGVVLGISLGALIVSVLLALQLARLVIVPLTAMTRGVRAIAGDNFTERLTVTSGDELGELAAAFNEMAEHLTEFRRSNLGEVLRAKAALEATLQALPDAVILFDDARRVLSMNRRATALLGIEGQTAGLTAEGLSVAGVRLSAHLDETRAPSGSEHFDLAGALRIHVDGAERRLLARTFRVPDVGDVGHRIILLLSDVTELARLDEMRAELIAVASHELRTPLTTLRMTLSMLQEDAAALPERAKELVAICSLGVQQLGETVDEFLDLTRIESGQLRLNVEGIDIRGLLQHAAGRWKARAAEQGIDLSLVSVDARVEADAVRLRVVLDNLLSNALKYTPRGGKIRLDARLRETASHRAVDVSVADTGPGIPWAYRDRIFDKFFRVEHHVAEGDKGTRGVGIGLYLCRQIVGLHGGRIRYEPTDVNGGTRISFEIPEQHTA